MAAQWHDGFGIVTAEKNGVECTLVVCTATHR